MLKWIRLYLSHEKKYNAMLHSWLYTTHGQLTSLDCIYIISYQYNIWELAVYSAIIPNYKKYISTNKWRKCDLISIIISTTNNSTLTITMAAWQKNLSISGLCGNGNIIICFNFIAFYDLMLRIIMIAIIVKILLLFVHTCIFIWYIIRHFNC